MSDDVGVTYSGPDGGMIALMLDFGLQDALCDLVQVHGVEYLDAFLERRLRRTIPQITQPLGHQAMDEMSARNAALAEKALRRLVENVRADPTPVPR